MIRNDPISCTQLPKLRRCSMVVTSIWGVMEAVTNRMAPNSNRFRMAPENACAKSRSRADWSEEARDRMRPVGVLSKKAMGARNRLRSMVRKKP